MTEIPSHQDLETYVGSIPRGVIQRLPDTPRRAEALQRIEEAEALAHAAREAAYDQVS